jgi:hypothetical protein
MASLTFIIKDRSCEWNVDLQMAKVELNDPFHATIGPH